MGIKVEKTFFIDGRHSELLSTACELARRYIAKNKGTRGSGKQCYVDEYSENEINEVDLFLGEIWE